jgi:hypothetical protein
MKIQGWCGAVVVGLSGCGTETMTFELRNAPDGTVRVAAAALLDEDPLVSGTSLETDAESIAFFRERTPFFEPYQVTCSEAAPNGAEIELDDGFFGVELELDNLPILAAAFVDVDDDGNCDPVVDAVASARLDPDDREVTLDFDEADVGGGRGCGLFASGSMAGGVFDIPQDVSTYRTALIDVSRTADDRIVATTLETGTLSVVEGRVAVHRLGIAPPGSDRSVVGYPVRAAGGTCDEDRIQWLASQTGYSESQLEQQPDARSRCARGPASSLVPTPFGPVENPFPFVTCSLFE